MNLGQEWTEALYAYGMRSAEIRRPDGADIVGSLYGATTK